jgi:hypothetical protein
MNLMDVAVEVHAVAGATIVPVVEVVVATPGSVTRIGRRGFPGIAREAMAVFREALPP